MDRLGSNLLVIVPRSNLSCIGRITGFMASLNLNQDRDSFCLNPTIIVWQPMNTERTLYSIRVFYTLRNDDINAMGDYYFANVSFTGNDRIEFQSGDVIGYWHRFRRVQTILFGVVTRQPCYTMWNIETAGYTSYSVSPTSDAVNISDDNIFVNISDDSVAITTDRRPLIQVIFGKTIATISWQSMCN